MSDIATYADIPTSTVILASMLVNLDLLELTKNWSRHKRDIPFYLDLIIEKDGRTEDPQLLSYTALNFVALIAAITSTPLPEGVEGHPAYRSIILLLAAIDLELIHIAMGTSGR
jgi:hypothetical protein